jgi:hypothetical protein
MPIKLAAGILLLALQVGFSGTTLRPTPSSASPYASALSRIQSEVAAHRNCFKTCTAKNTCTTSTLPTVCLMSNGVCATGTCR